MAEVSVSVTNRIVIKRNYRVGESDRQAIHDCTNDVAGDSVVGGEVDLFALCAEVVLFDSGFCYYYHCYYYYWTHGDKGENNGDCDFDLEVIAFGGGIKNCNEAININYAVVVKQPNTESVPYRDRCEWYVLCTSMTFSEHETLAIV